MNNRMTQSITNIFIFHFRFTNNNEMVIFLMNKLNISSDNTYTFAQPNCSQQNAEYWNNLTPQNQSQVFPCIADALEHLQHTYGSEEITLLVTGSLHLIGEVLRTIKDWTIDFGLTKIETCKMNLIFFYNVSKLVNIIGERRLFVIDNKDIEILI